MRINIFGEQVQGPERWLTQLEHGIIYFQLKISEMEKRELEGGLRHYERSILEGRKNVLASLKKQEDWEKGETKGGDDD